MSKSGMLRTRRRDINVKPNRRLDRKSSRGMIYENEELRLRTININAEIERGQSDIKKLRRENEQLRKEIWCLRDEYEKLDKLLKEKSHDETGSCSSCTSDITDSSSSCTESEENETTQNLQNVHKTTLNGLRAEFDHLSVVTEETSADNSDKNSNSAASPPHHSWTAIQPDQSYPQPPPSSTLAPLHFFSPIRPSRSAENCRDNSSKHASSWSLGPTTSTTAPYLGLTSPTYTTALQPCEKTSTDVLVKTDATCEFPNFTQRSTNSSFTNGGNLDELLQDIQTISNDILQISAQNQQQLDTEPPELQFDAFDEINGNENDLKPYKSELNVVLLPQPMPLLGFDKYQNLLSSRESLETLRKSSEHLGNVSPGLHRLSPVPPTLNLPVPDEKLEDNCLVQSTPPFPTDLLGFTPNTTPLPPDLPHPDLASQSNPFFYYENYQNAALNSRIGLEKYAHDNLAFKSDLSPQIIEEEDAKSLRKSNIENESIESKSTSNIQKSSTTSSELEQHGAEKSENEKNGDKHEKKVNDNTKDEAQKSPITRRTRKVSIYFKGKKDKFTRSLSLDTKLPGKMFEHSSTPLPDKKSTKISPKLERKISAPKSPSTDPKSGASDTKLGTFDPNKSDQNDKNLPSDGKTSSDSKNSDKKHRKSSSTSPERKHIHKADDGKKCHKKRHRKLSTNRNSLSVDRTRERSYSVCTDRSNILDQRFGHFDELTNSERDRSNSISSCDTVKSRKMSTLPNLPTGGKIPWFGCWGNGCL